MGVGRFQQAQGRVEALLEEGALAALPDGQLLERFVSRRDETAFAVLLRRHGPMVLGVCRSIVRDSHDAEDAFQATFLVLACKAGKIRRLTSVASWLHGTARRVALKARARSVRRQAVEGAAAQRQMHTGRQADDREWLHEELGRLPERSRQVLILCHLEGKTQAEAAAALGCPPGSVSRHLRRACELLRERLTARGLALSAGALVTLLEAEGRAAVPAVLLRSTLQTIAGHVAGATLTAGAAEAVILAREVLPTMTSFNLKGLAALVLLLGVIAAGSMLPAGPRPGDEDKAPDPRAGGQQDKAGPEAEPPGLDRHGDLLPPGAVARLGSTRLRLGGQVQGLAFSHDGKLVAGLGGGVLCVWSAATGKELARGPRHQSHGVTLAFAPDDKTLVYVGDGSLIFHDLSKISEKATAPLLLEDKYPAIPHQVNQPFLLAFSADGKTLLSGDNDGLARFFEVASGREVRSFGTPDKRVYRFALSPDGKTLAVAPLGKAPALWDVESGKMVGRMPGEEPVQALAFSPDGKRLAAGIDSSDAIRLWDVATRREVRSFVGKKEPPLSPRFGTIAQGIAFTPDGKSLVSLGGHEDDRLRVWEVETGKQERLIRGQRGDGGVLALSPDGRAAAIGGRNSTVRLWDLTTGKEVFPDLGRQASVEAVAVAPDGRLAATGSFDGVVRLYERGTGRELRSFPAEPHSIMDLRFSPDGKSLLSAVAYHPARLWDVDTSKEVRTFAGATGGVRGVFRAAYSPDGTKLALAVPEPALQLVDAATGKVLRRFGEKMLVDRMAFSPDGRVLAGGGFDRALHLWDVDSGKELWVVRNDGAILAVAYSPDGRRLATADGELSVKLWDAATGECLQTWPKAPGSPRAVAFSPDGRLLAVARDESDVALFETATATEVRRLAGHTGRVWALAFSGDGRTLVTGSFDATALVWDLTGTALVKKPAAPLTDDDLEQLWRRLGDADGAEGYKAVWALTRSAKQAIPFLEKRLRAGAEGDTKAVARLIADLDSDTFEVREKASQALAKMGKAIEADLKAALDKGPSAEVRSRIEKLLADLGAANVDVRLRGLRLLTVLEYAAVPEAQAVLKHLAEKGPAEEMKHEAGAALKRLKGHATGEGK
jgi:RNA polymerase sigma factor (sigma-70 family)